MAMNAARTSRAQSEFDTFAKRWVDELVRAAYLMVGDQGEAEDVVQECLLTIARKWPRVRSMRHPGAYTRRVLFNLILDGSRSRARRRQELQEDETVHHGSTNTAVAQAEARLDLVDALAQLPARQRAVLVLRYFVDLPEGEIATVLGCAPGTVKSSAARGLSSLHEAIGSSEPNSQNEDAIQGAET